MTYRSTTLKDQAREFVYRGMPDAPATVYRCMENAKTFWKYVRMYEHTYVTR